QEPILRTIREGPELQAARCSLGCLGIITSLRFPVRKQYHVEEHLRAYSQLTEVLAQEESYPIHQFYYLPWRWDFLAQHRREVEAPISRLLFLYRLYWHLGLDITFHVFVRFMARRVPGSLIRLFYRRVLGLFVVRRWRVVDQSQRQLTMQHELFR